MADFTPARLSWLRHKQKSRCAAAGRNVRHPQVHSPRRVVLTTLHRGLKSSLALCSKQSSRAVSAAALAKLITPSKKAREGRTPHRDVANSLHWITGMGRCHKVSGPPPHLLAVPASSIPVPPPPPPLPEETTRTTSCFNGAQLRLKIEGDPDAALPSYNSISQSVWVTYTLTVIARDLLYRSSSLAEEEVLCPTGS
ncbi:unnamed protein product [Pleuronectes platessa]|uniref:Uncharacterized protein n=1 Tax=Pleuronectes platessa TaxID=8262 RepID=A0A9N7Z8M9_PLEPL|nr:unnamed protein product [Pleuronectes platessa]